MRLKRETIFAAFVFIWSARGVCAAGVNRSALDALTTLHLSDWSKLDVKAASEKVNGELAKRWVSDDRCGAEVDTFKIAGDRNGTLRLRFEPLDGQAAAENCSRYLFSVRYDAVFDLGADAEAARMSIVAALRAGGAPEVNDTTRWQFRWRSLDSRTRFELSAAVSHKERYVATIFLQHADVQPAAVDYLPFEKGYMGCKCNNSAP